MRLVIKTAQMYVGKLQPDFLDITVKSGDVTFAPTWDIVMGYKNGKMTWDQYVEEYTRMMRVSYSLNKERWLQVLRSGSVTLTCYCAPTQHCHRYLLAGMLEKAGKANGIEVIYEGEVKR